MAETEISSGEIALPKPGAGAVAGLSLEYGILFFGLPTLYYLDIFKLPLIPYLCGMALITTLYLLRKKSFDRRQFWNHAGATKHIGSVLLVFAANAIAIAGLVYFFLPDKFLEIPRRSLALWGFIMLLYPLFSVYPQEIIYRVFMFERYRPLFGTGAMMVVASATAFGFGHIIFGNWIAVPMTLIGGILFGITYARSKSALLVAIEHALYGDLVFTIGLGSYFYTGG